MALDSLKISIRNAAGLYYYAIPNDDNTYTINTDASVRYIDHLPVDWMGTALSWQRNMTYYGVFRAQAEAMKFVKDARAILLSIMYGGGGVNGYALITVYTLRQGPTIGYDVFFEAEVDLSSASDDKQKQIFTVPLLESRAVELLKAKSSSNFNIPFWVYNGEDWEPNGEIMSLQHQGIKLRYNATWVTPANDASLDTILQVFELGHWNNGEHGTGPNRGTHMLFPANLYNIVQNNGTTTYIGNDIMQPLIYTSNQGGFLTTDGEVNFADVSRPFTSNNNLIRVVGIPSVSLNVSVKGKVYGDIFYDGSADFNLKLVLFEIDGNDQATETTPGFYDVFATLFEYTIVGGAGSYTPPDSGNFDTTDTPNYLTFVENKVYCFGIIFQNNMAGTTGLVTVNFSSLEISAFSNYNSGTGSPVDAPTFPNSSMFAMRPINVWQKLISSIDSVSTNIFGMPEIVGDFNGVSDHLSTYNDPDNNYDMSPNRTLYTSENAIRDIRGVQYISMSIADFFNINFRTDGCGLGIEGNDFRIEKLSYFFDASTEILALGESVSGLTIVPMPEQMFNNIKAGYKSPVTNNNFGVDEFNTPAEYNLPLDKTPKTQDLSVTSIVTGMYEIEKMRAQRNVTEISAPSASNTTVVILSTDFSPEELVEVLDPAGATHMIPRQEPTIYGNAQSTDPTAATDPYISGLYYPDTAINIGLLPPHNLYRMGPLLRAIADQQDSGVLTYRKQYQQNYANPLTPLLEPGVNVNITGAHLVGTATDIPINTLGDQLFRPYLFRFTANYPSSMYTLINANPNGYISFVWKGELFKGFISSIKQVIGNNLPTEFELIAHPSTTNAQLAM